MRACDDMPKALTGRKREERLSKKHKAFLAGFDACIEMVDNFFSDSDGWEDLVRRFITGDALYFFDEGIGIDLITAEQKTKFLTVEQKTKFLIAMRNRLETRLNLRRNEIALDFLDKDNKSTL